MLAVASAALVLSPLVQLMWRAGAGGWEKAAAIIFRPRTLDLLLGTVTLAGTVGAICLVLGILIATASVRVRLPMAPLWPILACLPLAVPSFVAAFAWTATLPQWHGFLPLAVVLVVTSVPLVTVPTMAALAQTDHSLAEVARTLGRGRIRAFLTLTLPQILPAALAGTLLVMLYAISDFGSPAILRHQTLTTGVYSLFSGGIDRSASASVALVLAALALVIVIGERRMRVRSAPGVALRAVTPTPPRRLSRPATAAVLGGLLLAFVCGVISPFAAMVGRWWQSERFGIEAVEMLSAAATTLGLGAAAGVVTVLIALPLGYALARYRSRLLTVAESASYLSHALPGVVVALALVALSLTFAPGAYQSLPALIASYALLGFALSLGATRGGFALIPPSLEAQSRTLGRGPVATWFRVTLRCALPGIVAGWVLVTTSVMKELPATLMLRPIGVSTLATEFWSRTTLGAYGAAAPIGIVLVLVGVIPALMMAATVRSGDGHAGSVKRRTRSDLDGTVMRQLRSTGEAERSIDDHAI